LVIAGPTASGKTGAALELARRLGGELIGADSVQVYRGFDIGSAKPTAAELGAVPHHLIDVIDPSEEIDAADYARRADAAIAEIRARGSLPIVVGGTGLWIRALVRGLVDLPPVDADVRRRLEAAAQAEGAPSLHERLAVVDPTTAGAVHPNDALRIVRALEVYEQTGVPLGTLREKHASGAPRYHTFFVALDVEREAHTRAIEARIQTMIGRGWAKEVRELLTRWGDGVRPFGSVGYREMLEHVRDDIPLDEAVRRIRKSTRTYARRQRTWFKGERDVRWWTDQRSLLDADATRRIAQELRL
jgi:tRNA dimethylallyltransferase